MVRKEDGTSKEEPNGKLRHLKDCCDQVNYLLWCRTARLGLNNPIKMLRFFSQEGSPLAAEAGSELVFKIKHHKRVPSAKEQSWSTMEEMLRRLQPYSLTKYDPFVTLGCTPLMRNRSELLMIVNHRPKDEAVLETLIEEIDTRLSAAQQREVIDIVADVYGLNT